jgi:UDP-N-acetylglucosamine--dolichyl-phosphate N-acetylglucosaminephosphotransferase
MDYILLFSLLVSFLVTLIVLPMWIKKARVVGLLWEDMNKYDHPKNVASSGGIVVVMAFVLSLLAYLFLKTFIFERTPNEVEVFALLSMVLIFGLIGLTDDLLGWKNGGLSSRTRVILAIVASVPLIVINAGNSLVNVPFFGVIDFGLLFPFLIIPLAIGFVSTTYNFLAGFNGLEAGLGVLILSYLSFVAFVTGSLWLSVVGLCMVFSLVVFLYYNFCPAKVFPGDILTYSIGALIVGMAILGDFERVAFIVFIPFLIEVVLKARGGLKKQSFGKPLKNGGLALKYDKIYGLTHFSIWFLGRFKKRVTEKDVVYFIYAIQIVFILFATLFLFSI